MERIDAAGVLVDKPGAQIAVDHLPALAVGTVQAFLLSAPAGAVLLAQQVMVPPVRNLVRYQGFDAGVEITLDGADGAVAGDAGVFDKLVLALFAREVAVTNLDAFPATSRRAAIFCLDVEVKVVTPLEHEGFRHLGGIRNHFGVEARGDVTIALIGDH